MDVERIAMKELINELAEVLDGCQNMLWQCAEKLDRVTRVLNTYDRPAQRDLQPEETEKKAPLKVHVRKVARQHE